MADYRHSPAMPGTAIPGAYTAAGSDRKPRSIGRTIVTVAATLAVVGAVALALKAPAVLDYKQGVGVAQAHELQPSPIDPSWIISGDPQFRNAVFEESSFWATSSGIWE